MVFDDTEVGYGLRATEKHIPSFEEKINTIFLYSIYALNATEKRYKQLIKDILPDEKVINEESLTKKIALLNNLEFEKRNDHHYIQSLYIDIFNILKEILFQFEIFLKNNPTRYGKFRLIPLEDDLEKSFHDVEITGNIDFRNRVISLIFPLQIKIYEINKIINSPPGIPTDPAVKKVRSSLGGSARNYGESVLSNKILHFLFTKRPNSNEFIYPSVTKLFEEHEEDLADILAEYQKSIGHPLKTGGPKISYGDSLTPHGLIRKIRQWSKKYPDFNAELKKHIKERNKIKTHLTK